MVLVCLRNPAKSTITLYSPAGRAGITYSPVSEHCTDRESPVAVLETDTFALATLPPEASTTRPVSVAFTAWLKDAGGQATAKPSTRAARNNCRDTVYVVLLTTHPLTPAISFGSKRIPITQLVRQLLPGTQLYNRNFHEFVPTTCRNYEQRMHAAHSQLFCPELNRKGNPAQEKCSPAKGRVNQPDWWHSPLPLERKGRMEREPML